MTVHASLLDQQWLTEEHQKALAVGGMCVPEFVNFVHDAVLVSVPQEFMFTEVSWVDRDLAELVWLLYNRFGIQTVESCQGGERGTAEVGEVAYLAFRSWLTRFRFLRWAIWLQLGYRDWNTRSRVVVDFNASEIPWITERFRFAADEGLGLV